MSRATDGRLPWVVIDASSVPCQVATAGSCCFAPEGDSSEVIKANWDVFGAVFTNIRAVEKVMSNLNTLRGPIAHCSPLAEDERLRLRLAVADWFRLGE